MKFNDKTQNNVTEFSQEHNKTYRLHYGFINYQCEGKTFDNFAFLSQGERGLIYFSSSNTLYHPAVSYISRASGRLKFVVRSQNRKSTPWERVSDFFASARQTTNIIELVLDTFDWYRILSVFWKIRTEVIEGHF